MLLSNSKYKSWILIISLFCTENFDFIKCPNVVNKCTFARTCSQCISTWGNCKWCADEQFNASSRCNTQHRQCANRFEVNPKSSISRTVTDDQRKQLKPQKVEIELRAGSFETISVAFKRSEDYPLDLYYLMDVSCTMAPHKKILSSIGNKLAFKLRKTTKDFRIGFGSFVDKETTPFSYYTPFSQMGTICKEGGLNILIADVHNFVHQMKLSSDTEKFKREVEATRISGNLDDPEGTLDALMQVMACGNEIGWRNDSDKIIVVATDDEYHIAADGKLAGIVIPNDGKCHLDSTGRYIGSLTYDYPTMHHIAAIAKEKKYNIIFSIPNKIKQEFEILSKLIGSNSRVTQLVANAAQITKLVEEVYNKISTSVRLVIENQPKNVEIEIWSKCSQSEKFQKISNCKFSGKPEILFNLKIRLLYCTNVGVNTVNKIVIGLPNMNEKIEITLRELCKCGCEANLRPIQLNSRKCSSNGTFSCGICTKCNGKRTGQTCDCDPERPVDPMDPKKYCRKSANDPHLCSGRGRCECQKCVCDAKWSGDHCDQDESECYDDKSSNVKCNDLGSCNSNQCDCSNSGFIGKYCECILSNLTCISNQTSGQICNDRGECRCGKCKCDKQTSGKLCEKCPSCEAPIHCNQLLSCIPEFRDKFCLNSSHSQNDSINLCIYDSVSCGKILQKLNYVFVETIFDTNMSKDVLEDVRNSYPHQCRKVIDNCDVSYDYRLMYGLDMLHFKVTNYTLNCAQPVNLVKIGLGAFITVFLIGLVTLVLWKLLTDYYDRREYARFIIEVDNAEFAENLNPLYKNVKLRVKNPMLARVRDRTTKFFSNVFVKRSSNKMIQIQMSEM